MRVLLDQATPLPIGPYLVGHSVRTAAQQGWATLGNGDLLRGCRGSGFRRLIDHGQEHTLPTESCRPQDRNCGTGSAAMAATSSPRPTCHRSYSGSHARQLCRNRHPVEINPQLCAPGGARKGLGLFPGLAIASSGLSRSSVTADLRLNAVASGLGSCLLKIWEAWLRTISQSG
jgi:hypothetical protein